MVYLSFGSTSELRVRFCAGKTALSFPQVFLLTVPKRLPFCCSSVVSYVAFVLSYYSFTF